MRRLAVYAAVLMLMVSVATPVFAGTVGPAPVPEIDGGSLSAGLGLLAGGVLLLRARFGRK